MKYLCKWRECRRSSRAAQAQPAEFDSLPSAYAQGSEAVAPPSDGSIAKRNRSATKEPSNEVTHPEPAAGHDLWHDVRGEGRVRFALSAPDDTSRTR